MVALSSDATVTKVSTKPPTMPPSISGTVIRQNVSAGDAWGIFSGGSKGVPSTYLGMWPDGNHAAVTANANLDYNLSPNLALRITPNWIGTTFGSTFQSNVGFNAGVVYRFGRMK